MALPRVNPGEVGLDARRLAVADSLVRSGQEEGIYPAAVLAVARRGKIAHERAFGALQPGGAATAVDTIFDLASVTKPHTALGLLTLVEDGRVALTQEVQEFIPEARGAATGPLTLRYLATHTSGLPPWKPLYKAGVASQGALSPGEERGGDAATLRTPLLEAASGAAAPPSQVTGASLLPDAHDRILAEILRTPLHNPPGAKYAYSDLGYILIGEIVARASGMSLDQYLHARVFAPLGMNDTGYLPAPTLRRRIAATSNSALQGKRLVTGEVHDENAYALGGVAGHAGLFGTAPDLAIAASALGGDGEIGGHRLLGMPTLRLVRASQADPGVGGHSIGWMTPANPMLPRGDILGDSTFGHTGFTGTMVVIEPSLHLAVVLLTNRVVNPADGAGIARIRRRTLNAVASAVMR